MDFVVVPDNTPPATSRTRDLIEGLKCHSLVCSAWFLRHTRSTRCIRLPLCALNERALKRRYVMITYTSLLLNATQLVTTVQIEHGIPV
jgi:hypothetical protein